MSWLSNGEWERTATSCPFTRVGHLRSFGYCFGNVCGVAVEIAHSMGKDNKSDHRRSAAGGNYLGYKDRLQHQHACQKYVCHAFESSNRVFPSRLKAAGMALKEKLLQEAQERDERLSGRFDNTRCISCGAAKGAALSFVEFRWRKQVSLGAEHHVRVEHSSRHLLCRSCWAELSGRRRWFWPLRYAGGIAVAAGLCGIVTAPALLYFMRLTPAERSELLLTGALAIIFLCAGILGLWFARRFSVPASLLDMTSHGWECIGIRSDPADTAVDA